MMINKRLIRTVRKSKRYIAVNVACQWISLAANIAMTGCITIFLSKLFAHTADMNVFLVTLAVAAGALLVRFVCTAAASRMSYLSAKSVKRTLREMIYQKLLRLGTSYKTHVNTSEVVQVAVEGVEQLETYFGAYLPQFFYAMLAPLTLFIVLSFISLPAAILLFCCVPLIPAAIIAVQRWAKKLLSKYWGQYTALGDITSDIELLEVFYAHTVSPAAIAFLFCIIMCVFIGSYSIVLALIALAAYLTVGVVIPLVTSKKAAMTVHSSAKRQAVFQRLCLTVCAVFRRSCNMGRVQNDWKK